LDDEAPSRAARAGHIRRAVTMVNARLLAGILGRETLFRVPMRSTLRLMVIPMNENPPDRLSNDPRSPFHNAEMLDRGVGVRFNGVEKTNVEEYCVSEGWIRVTAGTAKDRQGNPMTIKLKGEVEPYFRQGGTPSAQG
jgi:hypothetical protein